MRTRALVAALLVSPMTTFAATEVVETDGEKLARLGRIQVTATRSEEDAATVPIAITVVDKHQIERTVVQTVADLVHGEPGTFVQQTTPGQGNIIIRGLKGSEVLHMVDGFRLNNAFMRNAPNQYMALVDPLNLDRIEVVRGPMSTLYGSDAMGGVIQLLTPEPRFAGDQWQTAGLLKTRYSSADESTHSRAAFSAGDERIGFLGGISYQNVGSLHTGDGEALPYTAYTQQSGDFKLLATPAPGHELTFSLQYSKQPETPRYDALVPGFDQTHPDNDEFLFKPQERKFGQIRYRYTEPLAFADSIDIHLGQQTIIDDRTTREFASNNREIEENSSALRGLTAVAAKSIGERHYLTYGVETYKDRVDSFRQRENIATGAVTDRPSRYPDGSTMDSLAAFVADDWRVSESVELLGGLRYSLFDISMPSVNNAPGVDLSPDKFTGQLGFAWEFSPGMRLVANAGQGFRAPNIFDLGTLGDRPSNRYNIPNPELKPETVNSVEMGIKTANAVLEFEAVAFKANYKDKITSVLTGEQTESGRDIVQSQNATRLDLWGIESGVRWQATYATSVRASLTYTRGEEELAGDSYPADRIPPIFGRVGVLHAFDNAWEIEAWSLYASRQDELSPRDAVDARINPDGTAGWATLNARLGWQATEKLLVQLQIENMTDKLYREHGSGIDDPGRNISLSMDWAF